MAPNHIKYGLLAAAVLTIAVSSHLYYRRLFGADYMSKMSPPDPVPPVRCEEQWSPSPETVVDSWEVTNTVRGPPTLRFRDNLLSNLSYITSGTGAGFTNQFIVYVNLIYLSTISDRIPVIPPFSPDHHIPHSAGILPFGEIFDLTALRTTLRMHVLEWLDVKYLPPSSSKDPFSTSEIEHIGCWSLRVEYESSTPFGAGTLIEHLGLDVSYTRVASEVRSHPENKKSTSVMFSSLAALIFPRKPLINSEDLPLMVGSPLKSTLSPDTQMTCFDMLYYMTSSPSDGEWESSWSPSWRFVGQHLHFKNSIVELGVPYLRRVFSSPEGKLPPFISVHIRHGDFSEQCEIAEWCTASLSKYAGAVEEVRDDLKKKLGIDVHHVLVSSDETNPSFWKDVRNLGWKYVNHTQEATVETNNEWYPPIIDIFHHSLSVGFVGTHGSTFSLVSQRRVEDWNNGVAKLVQRWK